jgi:glutathione-regulated potassium-efflux system ancillary protein KefC
MDPIWLLVAVSFGLLARQFRLPPLVGFLAAGFALNAMDVAGGAVLDYAADLGVLLLLFTIGLKLDLRSLLVPAIFGGGAIHMALTVIVGGGLFAVIGLGGLGLFDLMDWREIAIIAFALSFSSTVFGVKILEERGEIRARHAMVTIGILIIQDLLAVVFLIFASDGLPSIWALGLLALPLLRPALTRMLVVAGHGEVLVLFGLAAAMLGAELFDLISMKRGVGALVFGVMLSRHEKSAELAKALMGFKDFFLVGFFLSIGLIGFPSLAGLAIIALLIGILLPLKMLLFFLLLTRFRLRARTAFLTMLSLASFSEFGLIVVFEAVEVGWISEAWLVKIAIAVAVSFVLASLINLRAHEWYAKFENFLCRFQTDRRLPDDEPADIGVSEILIVGMGRVGRGAYRAMRDIYGDKVCGADSDNKKIHNLQNKGFNVISGDAEDVDFWRSVTRSGNLKLIMLAVAKHSDIMVAVRLLKSLDYNGQLGAIAKFEEDRVELEKAGVHAAFNYYTEVGTGFADHMQRELRIGQSGLPH